ASHVDMASEEGRARFLAQSKPLVAQIEAPALGAMLRRRLGELARLDAEEIQRLIPAREPERRALQARARSVRTPAPPAESKLLGRILVRPELAATVPADALTGRGPEAAALRAVLEYFRADPARTLGQASAYFDGSEHQTPISEALAEPLLNQADSPDFDLAAEIGGLVEKLRSEHLARRRGELARLLDAGTATPEEKAEYGRLHATLASSKSGNPPTEERSKL
ncbi:MAG TPA: hypothetical protein VII36_11590, partial [Usitatibacter sp.]